VFEDAQVAVALTSCVVPSDIVAIAVNCDVAPTAGVVPLTATELTVVADVGDFEHAAADTASPMIIAAVPRYRLIIIPLFRCPLAVAAGRLCSLLATAVFAWAVET
jgi:hypothetical protein